MGAGASGSIGVSLIFQEVEAFIDDDATVTTDGSLYIDADDRTVFSQLVGAGGGGQQGGFGVSAEFFFENRTVHAFIGDRANVTAKGNGDGILDPIDGSFGGNGITVDARARDITLLFAVAGAGAQDVAASPVISTVFSDTQAYIGTNARVNEDNTGADADQAVRVRAEHDTDILTAAGGLAVVVDTSGAGVGAAADVQKITKAVEAYIDQSARVNAQSSVTVDASSQQRMLSVVAGLSGGGTVTIAGSLADANFIIDTQAYIGANATVVAGGDVAVRADSLKQFSATAGQAAISPSTTGIGAAVVNTLIVKDTLASIDTGATVDADGRIEVSATSEEDIAAIAAGGAGAESFALGGSVAMNIITNTTRAYVDSGADLEADLDITITAEDDSLIRSLAGIAAASGGPAAVAAARGTNVIVNTVEAYIDSAEVTSSGGGVAVSADSTAEIETASAGGAGAESFGAGWFDLP